LADPRHVPLSFRPAPRARQDGKFDESLFDRAARRGEPLEDESEGEEARPTREGLPSSYRMRHDPHYVEEIATRPRPAIPPSVFGELTEHLGAIGACLHLFGDRDRPLRERVAMDLVHAEVQRAAWLSQALAVLAGDPPVLSNPIEMDAIVERLLASFTPERVLAGVEFDWDREKGPHVVQGDEQLLSIALAGLVSAVHALVERAPGARVRVRIERVRESVRVTVSQDVVSLPPASRTRFFDMAWPQRPGGVSAGARLAAARRVAELHGGKVQLSSSDRGCALTLTLPATSADR
jgi:hypothetical protein